MIKNKIMMFAALLVLLPVMAYCGPPFTTDDPDPVEFRHWEVYLFGQFIRDTQDINAIVPGLEVNYGLFPEAQIHFIFPGGFSGSRYGNLDYKYGSTEIGLKYRFIKETDNFPQVGTFPHADIASGNIAAGTFSGNTQYFIPIWLQKSWGSVMSYGGGGYWINPGINNLDWWFLGWVLQCQIADNMAVGMEINYNTPQEKGMAYNNSINVGVIYDINKNHHLMVSLGSSMLGEQIYQGYAAYQLTFGP